MNIYKVKGRSPSWKDENYFETYLVLATNAGFAESIVASHEHRDLTDPFVATEVQLLGTQVVDAEGDEVTLFDPA